LGDVIDMAAGRLGLPNPASVAAALRQREAEQPSLLGGGVAVPGLPLAQHPARAVLVLLDRPLAHATPDGQPLELVWVWAGAAPARARLLGLARLAALADRGLARQLGVLSRPEQVLASLAQLDAGLD
jgi:mannitol/fructose-specific phosphotransferase system IIA component (Ntr-type)